MFSSFPDLSHQRPSANNCFLEVFWQGQDKIGSNLRCPRDGRPGCALVDWLSPEHRQMQTHFMPSDWQPEMFAHVVTTVEPQHATGFDGLSH